MARPTIKRTLTTMRLPTETMRRLTVVARQQGRSRSNLVEHVLAVYLKRRGANETAETDDGTIFS